LRYHVERQTEENIAAGMNPREAREAAFSHVWRSKPNRGGVPGHAADTIS
jgi:hypothetical protein